MFQDIFIIGATGKVGRTLVSQIFEKDVNPAVHTNPTRIIGLASHNSYLYDAAGISRERAEEFCQRKSGIAYTSFDEWLSRVQGDYPSSRNESQLTFIDVTDSKEIMLRFHKRVMEETPHSIVTANKNPLVICDFKTFQNLTREVRRYGYRCSVMAGAEAVSKIRDLKDLGDSPIEISGCFSGTCGYVASELEKGRKLSEIVEEAVSLGYTEPNPADDFSGYDVARKITILARTAGCDIQKDSFQLEPFVPHEYLAHRNPAPFIAHLKGLDEEFQRKVEHALGKGNVLRYTAVFDLHNSQPKITIGLQEVLKNSPLGSLHGTRNKIVIKTKTYGENFYAVEAPGAGLETTAQNIRRDLLYQLHNRVIAH